jgi:monoamine oxidase
MTWALHNPAAMCGDSTFDLRKGVTRCAGRFPPLDAVALGEMFDLLDELTKTLHVDAPWLSPEAARLGLHYRGTVGRRASEAPRCAAVFPLFLGDDGR